VTEFVRTQKFERVSSFVSVTPALQRVVTNSTKLTVLIFSDGVSPLTGTPYDAQINAAYEPFRDTQKQERMPFVTVLRAKNQEYLGYAVTPSPWAVEFPKFPPEPVVVVPKVEPKPQPKPTVPPLIVIGKKDTNTTPAVELPQPGSEPKPEPKPGMTEAEKLFVKLAAEQGVELPPNYGSNVATSVTTPAATPRTNASAEQSKPIPGASEPPKPAPPSAGTTSSAQKNPEPKPAPVTASEPVVKSKSEPEIQAVVSPAAKNSGRLLLIAAVASILVVALTVAYALLRRRHRAHVSLITSSMDRGRK
jgi:hypothetical protein